MKTDGDGEAPILELVMDFCLSSGFEQRFRDFAERYARTFAHADMEEEHPLGWHQAYQQYLKEFEGYIEEFIIDQGSSLQEFYRQAKVALTEDEFSSRRFFVEALLACAEYGEFVSLMRSEVEHVRK